MGRLVARWPRAEALAAVLVLVIAVDVALVARVPMGQSMKLHAPSSVPSEPEFHFEDRGTLAYAAPRLAGSAYLDMLGNRGIIECYGLPAFGAVGARSPADPRYRGEAYVEGPEGSATEASARVAEWSPNHAVIELERVTPGSVVVYNMNFDEGWRSDAGPVIARDDKVAVRAFGPTTTVRFTYRPPHLVLGLLLALMAAGGCAALLRRGRARPAPAVTAS
jgi:hypothetical protein